MNVRDFLDVRVICETGSLRKAAKVLGVTQPTLSNRLAHLEDQLGAPLFDRSRGHSVPTDLALFIARRAATMADEAGRLAAEAKRLASGKGGLIRIGISPVPSRILFPEIVVGISIELPRISLDLLSGPTDQLAQGLISRELDLIICPALDGDHPEVASELLLQTDIVVVARPGHPLCADPPKKLEALFEYPIALPVTEHHYLEDLKRDHGIDIENLPGRILCADPSLLARIVQISEKLFTAAPRPYFKPELDAGLLRIVDTPVALAHRLYLHHNVDAFPFPAVKRVHEVIRKAFASLQQGARAVSGPEVN